VEVRAATAADIPIVRELFTEYATGLGIDLAFQSFAEERDALPGRYAPPSGRLLLAWDGDTAAGCIALRRLDEHRCEMKRLYVRPAYRGTGLGRVLTVRAIAEATAIGYAGVYLDTLPSMARAIELYRSLGFVPTEPYCHNPVPGALFLFKPLRSE
jgi:ribosomal protein S18 acetylase RimI-like enzyme